MVPIALVVPKDEAQWGVQEGQAVQALRDAVQRGVGDYAIPNEVPHSRQGAF